MIHESRIKTAVLIELRMSADVFSKISGVSTNRLSLAFRGLKDFSNEEVIRLTNLVQELRTLKLDAEPFLLSFENPQVVGALLRDLRLGKRWIPIPVGGECVEHEGEK